MRANIGGGEHVSADVGAAANIMSMPVPVVRYYGSLTLTGLQINTCMIMDAAGSNTITVPLEEDMPLPPLRSGLPQLDFQNGHSILIAQLGAGQTTIAAADGVTLLSVAGSPPFSLLAQYARASLMRVAMNTWLVDGSFA